jgi:hypothetical protein
MIQCRANCQARLPIDLVAIALAFSSPVAQRDLFPAPPLFRCRGFVSLAMLVRRLSKQVPVMIESCDVERAVLDGGEHRTSWLLRM